MWWKRLLGLRRYYLISYSHSKGFGEVTLFTKDGSFPPKKYVNSINGVNDTIILNIQELTRRDYEDYHK